MAATGTRPETDPQAPRRYRDLSDVDWPSFGSGDLPVWDPVAGKFTGGKVDISNLAFDPATQAEADAALAAAVATLNAAMATDSELAAVVATLNAAIAAKQDASSAATDAELAALDAEHDAAEAALQAAIDAKQEASTAATDAELAAAQAALAASIALKQDASTAATDAELAAAQATLNAAIALKATRGKAPGTVAWKSGRYYTPPGGSTTGVPSEGQKHSSPLWVPAGGATISEILCEVTAVGTAPAVIRLGIYADNGVGYPGALLLDAGTIPGDTTTGAKTITGLNLTLPEGLVWLIAVAQGAAATRPTMRLRATAAQFNVGGSTATATTAGQIGGYLGATATPGALQDPFEVNQNSTPNPVAIGVRAA